MTDTFEPTSGATVVQADPSRERREFGPSDVEDILANPSLSIEERQAALQELADQVGMREPADADSPPGLFQMQINEALNMLAAGGHSYVQAVPAADAADPAEADRHRSI